MFRCAIQLCFILGWALFPPIGAAQELNGAIGIDSELELQEIYRQVEADEVVRLSPPGALERWAELGSNASSALGRLEQVRAAAWLHGNRNLDSAARALLVSSDEGETRRENAQAAVKLAPDLPWAHLALAKAHWQNGEFLAAVRSLWAGLWAIPRHAQAAVWWRALGLYCLAWACFAGSALFVIQAALRALPAAAHDFGDAISRDLPAVGRWSVLIFVLLLPAALGEGWLGVAMLIFLLAFSYYRGWVRVGLLAASAGLAIGLHPLLDAAARALLAFEGEHVSRAVFHQSRALLTPGEAGMLDAAANEENWLPTLAAARLDRDNGDWEAAFERIRTLYERSHNNEVIALEAANMRLRADDLAGAITIYEEQVEKAPSAVSLFNLAEAHGRNLALNQQEAAMGEAQQYDREYVRALSEALKLQDDQFPVDPVLSEKTLLDAFLSESVDDSLADQLRYAVAPGVLGRDFAFVSWAFAFSALAGTFFSRLFRLSQRCNRCGLRLCPRCQPRLRTRGQCAACEGAVRRARAAGLAPKHALRSQLPMLRRSWIVLVELCLPGASALRRGQPLLGLLMTQVAVLTIAFIWAAWSGIPDPLVLGPFAKPFCLSLVFLGATSYFLLWLRSRSSLPSEWY